MRAQRDVHRVADHHGVGVNRGLVGNGDLRVLNVHERVAGVAGRPLVGSGQGDVGDTVGTEQRSGSQNPLGQVVFLINQHRLGGEAGGLNVELGRGVGVGADLVGDGNFHAMPIREVPQPLVVFQREPREVGAGADDGIIPAEFLLRHVEGEVGCVLHVDNREDTFGDVAAQLVVGEIHGDLRKRRIYVDSLC